MATELKIIITCMVLWFVTHFAAYPSTGFANWGEKTFGSYTNFINAIMFVYLIPAIFAALHWVWSI